MEERRFKAGDIVRHVYKGYLGVITGYLKNGAVVTGNWIFCPDDKNFRCSRHHPGADFWRGEGEFILVGHMLGHMEAGDG